MNSFNKKFVRHVFKRLSCHNTKAGLFIHKYSEILHRTFRATNECKVRETHREVP